MGQRICIQIYGNPIIFRESEFSFNYPHPENGCLGGSAPVGWQNDDGAMYLFNGIMMERSIPHNRLAVARNQRPLQPVSFFF